MGLTKNVKRTERILRMSGGIAGIFLFLPLGGPVRWVPLGLGVFLFVTGVINY